MTPRVSRIGASGADGSSAILVPNYHNRRILISPEDADRVLPLTWGTHHNRGVWEVYHQYWHGRKLKRLHLSRLVMNAPPGIIVDHADGDRLNNTRQNLRFATAGENAWNSRKQSRPTKSRYKGVCANSLSPTWRAYIHLARKQVHLGCYSEERDAAVAYDVAARAHFGEFACLNFPDDQSHRSATTTRGQHDHAR